MSNETTEYTLNDQTYTLRRYGSPGRYETGLMVDVFVGDGETDDELGDVETFGHYAIVRGNYALDASDQSLSDADLTEQEKEFLRDIAGAIVYTNSSGFVEVTYYETAGELDAAWAHLEAEYAATFEAEED